MVESQPVSKRILHQQPHSRISQYDGLLSGKILLMETKGEQLDNDLSRIKAKIGDQWVKLAGRDYKYYMVYEEKRPGYPEAISLEQFLEIVKGM